MACGSRGSKRRPRNLLRRKGLRRRLADRLRYLEFRGMGVRNLPVQFPLNDIYVDLKARADLPKHDTLSREMRRAAPSRPHGHTP